MRVRFARTFEVFGGVVLDHDDPHIELSVVDHESNVAEAWMTLREAETLCDLLTRAIDRAKFLLTSEERPERRIGSNAPPL